MLGRPPDAKCEPVKAGSVPAEWVDAPGSDPTRAVLYLHGGGYVIGSINTHRRLAYNISAASGARVLVIDYRLAPEHPFPAAIEDAAEAWRWLLQQGFAPKQLAIAGDSAGGGLTLRDPGQPARPQARPAGLRRGDLAVGRSRGRGQQHHRARGGDPMVQKDGLLWMAGFISTARMRRRPSRRPCMPS